MSVTSRSTTESASAGVTLQTVNPATGENGRAYRAHTIDEARRIAAACAAAQRLWRKTPIADRGKLMHAARLRHR